MSDSEKTALTLGLTFPLALLVGIMWCLCLTKTCGISNHKKRLPLDKHSTHALEQRHNAHARARARSYDEQQEEEIIEDDEDFDSYEEQGVTMEIPNEIPERSWHLRADSF